jgi:hypothetical protein
VQLYAALGGTKKRPRAQREAQIYGGCIQSVDRVLDVQPKVFALIEFASYFDEILCDTGVYAPVANRICIGERVAGNGTLETHVI